MKDIEAIREAAKNANIPVTHIGRALGKRENYVSVLTLNARERNSHLQTDTAAAMLGVCGYVLCAIPKTDIPANALVIDAPQKDASI